MNQKISIHFLLLILLFPIIVKTVNADSDEDGGIFGEDGAKELGNIAIILMVIGSSYIILRRSHVYSKLYISKEKYPKIRNFTKETYSKYKSFLLNLHYIVMLLATLAGLIHGILLGMEEFAVGITGWIASIFMILLSFSGIFIWYRFKPIWDYRKARTHLRFIHQQWLFSGLMIIALILHVGLFED